MAIDEPQPEAAARLVRQSSVISQTDNHVVRRQSSKQLVVEVPRVRHGAAGPLRQSRKQLVVRETNVEVDEEEELRAHKKRRTSSEADELEQQERERQLQVISSDDVTPAPVASLHEQLAKAEPDFAADAGWEDLDAEDADDPLMVAEYVVDIFNYLKSIESSTMPNPGYMSEQTTITWGMRGTLVDWMISVHTRFRFLPETLFLAVNILDRFLSMRLASVEKLQLVGSTAMFIAAKTEEMFTPGVQRFVDIADNAFTDVDLLKAEKYMLKIIEWNLSYPNPINFLRRVSKADEYNIKVRTLAKFFCEIGVVDWRLLGVQPSLLAASAMWLGRLVLGSGEWGPNLVHYSTYSEETIIPVANLMLNYILKPKKHENFWKKYASKKFYKVCDWAEVFAFMFAY
ncbi:A/B/D/E cyclin [Exidia glandulosa HHB12029]|uniref:A/B/D/E cyclin n=1 Tax=Exidia glandulosa HHB12029 TaxID=1314781 RepID=A0A166BBA0_EXIGL|nr:A/B/D/E cyclin [Exidia glandulosa HHB12029]